ncbi:hypothetical protein DIRU0_A00188 [Diutina rugosa]
MAFGRFSKNSLSSWQAIEGGGSNWKQQIVLTPKKSKECALITNYARTRPSREKVFRSKQQARTQR